MQNQTRQNIVFEASRYPAELIDTWQLRNGTWCVLRPVLARDGPLIYDMMARMSPASRRDRCHGAVKNFSSCQLKQLSCVDHARHVAFVITTTTSGQEQVIADARYVVDGQGGGDSGEFAVVVQDHWHRLGLGARAMQALTSTAAKAGLRWLHGDVMAENLAMLALMRHCNICCEPDCEDGSIVHAGISLDSMKPAQPKSTLLSRLWGWSLLRCSAAGPVVNSRLQGARHG